eukprot:11225094-Lingulodinium_polyedra.AAC.1
MANGKRGHARAVHKNTDCAAACNGPDTLAKEKWTPTTTKPTTKRQHTPAAQNTMPPQMGRL